MPQLGEWAAQLAHGRITNIDGDLLAQKFRIPRDDIWRLGQAYLGMLGLLALPLCFGYMRLFHQATGFLTYHYDILGRRVAKHHLGFWSDLPLDLKVIVPLTFLLHFIGLASAIRWMIIRKGLPLRSPDD